MAFRIWSSPRVAVILSIAACDGASSQTPDDFGPVPGPRGYAQLVAHPPSGSVVLFGGESNSRFSYEAVWSYRVSTDEWERFDVPMHPTRVGGVAAAYDAESDRIVFHFTTRLDADAPRGLSRVSETWALDVRQRRWTRLTSPNAPFGLMGARMAYDSDSDRIILFGGADFTGSEAEWFNQTWSYDLNSDTWTAMGPETSPPGRSYFGMAYDPVADLVLTFGGSPVTAAADLWAYDYDTDAWQLIPYTGTVRPDHHPTMTHVPSVGRTYYMVDTTFSMLDLSERRWASLARPEQLGRRFYQAMAFDGASGRLVVFGGGPRGLQYTNDVWTYDPVASEWFGGP